MHSSLENVKTMQNESDSKTSEILFLRKYAFYIVFIFYIEVNKMYMASTAMRLCFFDHIAADSGVLVSILLKHPTFECHLLN